MDKPAGQLELTLNREVPAVHVPVEMIYAKKNQGAAFSFACDTSTLEDKEIYGPLGIDAGTFSRMRSGKNTLPGDQIAAFCKLVNNTIYPQWLAYQIGCGLVMIKTEAERRAEAAEERARRAEDKLAIALEIINGRAAA